MMSDTAIGGCRKRRVLIAPKAQALFCRRRHQPIAKIRTGSPIDVGAPVPIHVGRRFPTPSGRRTAVAGTSAFHLMSGYGTEQPVILAVDPVEEVQDIGAAVVASDPEEDRPEAASRLSDAVVDRDRAEK